MIVVSDTSPLTALLTVRQADLLPELFKEVIIPQAVRSELLRYHRDLPGWLRTQVIRDPSRTAALARFVDLGEAEAIVLATEIHADRLLMDERKGRKLAREYGLPVVGLLGVVLLAKQKRLVPSARDLLESLDREAGIYLAEELKTAALKTVGE